MGAAAHGHHNKTLTYGTVHFEDLRLPTRASDRQNKNRAAAQASLRSLLAIRRSYVVKCSLVSMETEIRCYTNQ